MFFLNVFLVRHRIFVFSFRNLSLVSFLSKAVAHCLFRASPVGGVQRARVTQITLKSLPREGDIVARGGSPVGFAGSGRKLNND